MLAYSKGNFPSPLALRLDAFTLLALRSSAFALLALRLTAFVLLALRLTGRFLLLALGWAAFVLLALRLAASGRLGGWVLKALCLVGRTFVPERSHSVVFGRGCS